LAKVDAKAKSDALAAVNEKARLDGIVKVAAEKEALELANKAKEQARIVEAARLSREKATADSIAFVKSKISRDSLALVNEKAKQDQLAKNEKDKSEKAERDRIGEEKKSQLAKDAILAQKQAQVAAESKRLADIEAQKKALGGNSQAQTKKSSTDVTAYRFDFDKDFIPEGIKEETIKEPNRNIVRTIVNSKEAKATYLKIIYSYGGVFYFKNSVSISENMYNTELDNFRKLLK